MSSIDLSGVWPPIVTAFAPDGAVDLPRTRDHCLELLAHGARGIVLGTNTEMQSLSIEERASILEGLVLGGIAASRLIPATGAVSIPDTVRLTREAVAMGCPAVLIMPPFFYKGVSDDGIIRAVEQIITRVNSPQLRILMYHFPKISGVPVSPECLTRLAATFPEHVIGAKDSSGDPNYARQVLAQHPDLVVMPAIESLLPELVPLGVNSLISGRANLAPALLTTFLEQQIRQKPDSTTLARVLAVQKLCATIPAIPGLKAILADQTGIDGWRNPRPPLMALDPETAADLSRSFRAIFD